MFPVSFMKTNFRTTNKRKMTNQLVRMRLRILLTRCCTYFEPQLQGKLNLKLKEMSMHLVVGRKGKELLL